MNNKKTYYYCLVGNIPLTFHSSDLRNYFSKFIEADLFDIFHFRHRKQSIQIGNGSITGKEAFCAVVQFSSESVQKKFIRSYAKNLWIDPKGQMSFGECSISSITLSEIELNMFSKELNPPKIMPKGNVGTPTIYFFNQIKQCKLPQSIIKKLNLNFPNTRTQRTYAQVPFDYKTVNLRNDTIDEDELTTGKGHPLTDVKPVNSSPISKNHLDSNEDDHIDREDDDLSEEDDDRCEDWERHEALHDDVTTQERLTERLYEEEIEVVWEKGGPGIVWYTDAQFWDAQKGGFDEETSDDLDVDMQGYYVEGAGDKDAQVSLQMRRSERYQFGKEDYSLFSKPSSNDSIHKKFKKKSIDSSMLEIGKFENHTRGIGRKLMENLGWKEGFGLGKDQKGIKEALGNDGKPTWDKRGFGYVGEKLTFGNNHKNINSTISNASNKNDLPTVSIATIFDDPHAVETDDTTYRSTHNTFIKRYKF